MTASTTRDKILKKTLYLLISVLFWIALWDFISHKIGMKYVFPSPAVTASRLFQLMGKGAFYMHSLNTLFGILKGFLFGAIIGTVIGILSAFVRGADILFSPLNTVIKVTPVASFIILAFIWMDRRDIPALISGLIVAPIVLSALKNAVTGIDRELLEMARVYKMPITKRITVLYIPAVFSSYLASLLTAMGLAFKAGVAAEILCGSPNTLGNDLLEAKRYLETVDMFAYTLALILLSAIIEVIFKVTVKTLTGKRGQL